MTGKSNIITGLILCAVGLVVHFFVDGMESEREMVEIVVFALGASQIFIGISKIRKS